MMFAMRTLLLLLIAACFARAEAPEQSLLPNGDFELTDNDAPRSWFGENTDSRKLLSEDGNRFVRMHVTEPGNTVMLYKLVSLKPEHRALQLSFRVRYSGIERGEKSWFDGRIMTNFKDDAGKELRPAPPAVAFNGSSEGWVSKSVKFLVPEGATKLEFMPSLLKPKAGTLDVDDFSLVPIDPAELVQAQKDKQQAMLDKVRRAPDEPLISNGDFETIKGDATLGWIGANTPQRSRLEEAGNHFIRLQVTTPHEMVMLYRKAMLATDDKALELSFRYRTNNIKRGEKEWHDARIMMKFTDVTGKELPGAPAPYFVGTQAEWKSYSVRFPVPEGAVAFELMPSLVKPASGSFDLDDIRLVRLDADQTAQLLAQRSAADKQKAERQALVDEGIARAPRSVELKVAGNQIVSLDGQPVWLQGLSVDSMQWGPGERVLWTTHVAIDEWKANIIRLAIDDKRWSATDKAGDAYRKLVDDAAAFCAGRGTYLIIDYHGFGAPRDRHIPFWKSIAERYKNNPAVLFELFNEPHSISWQLWRDGGDLRKDKHNDVNPSENQQKDADTNSPGMQALVDAVRSTGARNLILAAGLDWGYDLSGVAEGFALNDPNGNGIVYVSHIYPWKRDWQGKVLRVAEKHPVIITEVGCPPDYSSFKFIPEPQRYPLDGWAQDVLGLIQKHKLHWTGFSFHPGCAPQVISDWSYTPTPYWGVYVKDALAGKSFEMTKMR